MELWNDAETQLSDALNEFIGHGNWRINKGDGAFYGPKIDIKVFDALQRPHQCATIQLDFQLPIRFDLRYKPGTQTITDEDTDSTVFERPVMVHRAMLGSVERISAILTEHWGGKWPFWLSPRQCVVVPVDPKYNDYAYDVQDKIHKAGFYVDVDDTTHTLNKKVREGQVAQYNFILVVGEKESTSECVCVRTRDEMKQDILTVDDFIEKCNMLSASYA